MSASARNAGTTKLLVGDLTPLYGAAQMRTAIGRLFNAENRHRRRVACVAFVGRDCLDFIPEPSGVEVYCWPQPGGTSAAGLRSLLDRDAVVHFVDRLHAKVYWAEGVGCVVGSANLSKNALDEGGLVECGVAFDDSTVIDIDRIIAQRPARLASASEILNLERANELLRQSQQTGGEARGSRKGLAKTPTQSFAGWLAADPASRKPWKIAWNADGIPDSKAYLELKDSYAPAGIDVECIYGRRGEYQPGDWVLIYNVDHIDDPSEVGWFYATHVRPRPPRDGGGGRTYPMNVLQIGPTPPNPPFLCDRAFKRRFASAAKSYTTGKLRRARDSIVPDQLLRALEDRPDKAASSTRR